MINRHPQNYSLGYVYISLCCLTSAISFVFIAHLLQTHNEMLSMALTFGYATLLFTIFNYKKLANLYRLAFDNFKPLFYLNIATLLSWFGTFIALKYIDPATKVCIGFGLIAVTNFFILTPLDKLRENKHLLFSIFFILLSMGLIINQYACIYEVHNTLKAIILGIAWSIIGGIGGGFIGVNAERIGKAGFSATQILATRFYLLVIVSLILIPFGRHAVSLNIDWKYYLLTALIIVFFPLLMYQLAIKSLGALIVSLIEPFTPVITYFMQVLFLGYRFNLLTLILLLFSSSAVIWLIRTEQKMILRRYFANKS